MLKNFLRISIILYPVFYFLAIMYALQDTILTEDSLNNSLRHTSLLKIIVEEIAVSLKDKTLSAAELTRLLDNLTSHHFQLARGQLREMCLPVQGTFMIAFWMAHVFPYVAWAIMWSEGKVLFINIAREHAEQRTNKMINRNKETYQWPITRISHILRVSYAITPVFAIFYIFHIDTRFNSTWPWNIGASPTPTEGFDAEFVAKISSLLVDYPGYPDLAQQVMIVVTRAAALYQSPVCGQMTAEMEKIALLSLLLYVVSGVTIEQWFQRECCASPCVHDNKESKKASRLKNIDLELVLRTQLPVETALDLSAGEEVLENIDAQSTEDGVLTPSSSDGTHSEDGIFTPDGSTDDGQPENMYI